jgi:hypothetical protein
LFIAYPSVVISFWYQAKDWFEGYSVADVLTIGQKDIMDNWIVYRERFIEEMKK